ncbi:type VI secretion system VasD/TssJ family lipoprotein [Paraburkholderia caballeronis]|uniref:type VI secretion system lipoprotein TssJ n=1 Tax=Paraburkholderia caballeronis TaxID=416943 RepID=UPI0010D027BE|nr:type VI secretion system lipoprotein TssJ [Paraburkholderia caballeronis]TDV28726.1 type VI secretion system VasD/TssJ family lipoprotein [Paraburkholderia caballeronis]
MPAWIHSRLKPFVSRASAAVLLACACSACSMFGGNSRKDAMSALNWDFAADAVMLEIAASPDLNRDEGQAHTLLLGIYEASDAASFRKLAANPPAVFQSMESGSAGPGFTQFARYVVSPGQHSMLILDRAQNTHFIGIVAAYAQAGKAVPTRLFDVPVVMSTRGWLTTTYAAAPGPLALRLDLGAQGIVNAGPLAKTPTAAQLQAAEPLAGGGKELKLGSGGDCVDCLSQLNTTLRKLGD